MFWYESPCCLVDVYEYFGGICCFLLKGRSFFFPEDGPRFVRNVVIILPSCMASHLIKPCLIFVHFMWNMFAIAKCWNFLWVTEYIWCVRNRYRLWARIYLNINCCIVEEVRSKFRLCSFIKHHQNFRYGNPCPFIYIIWNCTYLVA
jgi:hypothetical protein